MRFVRSVEIQRGDGCLISGALDSVISLLRYVDRVLRLLKEEQRHVSYSIEYNY